MTTESDFAKMAEILRKERDELGVKVHLAGMEVRDEWQELEEKWEQFSSNSKNFYKEVEPALGNIQAAETGVFRVIVAVGLRVEIGGPLIGERNRPVFLATDPDTQRVKTNPGALRQGWCFGLWCGRTGIHRYCDYPGDEAHS